MNEPNNHSLTLKNGWRADFTYRGEFKMGCDYWGLSLCNSSCTINYFANKIALVNDYNGESIDSCVRLDETNQFAKLCLFDEEYVIDFASAKLTCLKTTIRCNKNGKYVSVVDQPAMNSAQNYITVDGKLIYMTFPFVEIDKFDVYFNTYVNNRIKQISDLYFK